MKTVFASILVVFVGFLAGAGGSACEYFIDQYSVESPYEAPTANVDFDAAQLQPSEVPLVASADTRQNDIWEAAVQHAITPRTKVADGAAKWVGTTADLESYSLGAEKRLACAAAYGALVHDAICPTRLRFVISRSSKERGVIRYGVAEHVNSTESGIGPTRDAGAAACRPYTGCLVAASIGAQIRLPADVHQAAIERLVQFIPSNPDLLEVEYLRKIIAVHESGLPTLRSRAKDGTPLDTLEYLNRQDTVRHLKWIKGRILLGK